MPTFKGQVTEEQLLSLVAYIKSLSGIQGTAPGASNTAANSNTNSASKANTNSSANSNH